MDIRRFHGTVRLIQKLGKGRTPSSAYAFKRGKKKHKSRRCCELSNNAFSLHEPGKLITNRNRLILDKWKEELLVALGGYKRTLG